MQTRGRGQSLVEYGLVLGLIAVGSITVLLALGNNTDSLLNTIRSRLAGNQAANNTAIATTTAAPASSLPQGVENQTSPPALSLVLPGVPSQSTVCYSGANWCIDMSGGIAANPVNVAGANGMTEHVYAMENILRQISEQAAQDPSIDPALRQMITNLANKAHAVGEHDAYLFALPTSTAGYYTPASDFVAAKQAVETYLAAQPNALIPGVQQALNYATGEVNAHIKALLGREPDTGEAFVMHSNVQAAINEYTATQTHQQANQICQNGGQPPSCIVSP